ncbi:MAG: hypothetical protein DRG82_15865 [Deltaproteobacteria bacterium]|nr:MAG: hypothetical protein DRG82_15865 [Deltaproteobacteria bacterium]
MREGRESQKNRKEMPFMGTSLRENTDAWLKRGDKKMKRLMEQVLGTSRRQEKRSSSSAITKPLTSVSFRFKGFRFERAALLDIGRIGFPTSVSQISMFLMAFALTTIVVSVAGPNGVAVYTTGWRE